MTTTAWEAILNAGKSSDANRGRQRAEESLVEPGAAPEHDEDLTENVLQEKIADDFKSHVANVLATIPDMVAEAVEQLFWASTPSAQGGIRTVMYDAVEDVILDQIRMDVLGQTITKHTDQYFEAGKDNEALGKMLLRNNAFLPR